MKNSKLDSFKKPLVVIGLGKSGLAAAELLKANGFTQKDVLLFDEKKEGDLKGWADIQNLTPGTLVVSPGVPLQGENIQNLLKLGWALTSEISLACLFLTTEKIIGITGSVAKSTVTSLVGIAAITDDENAFVGGNLGIPFCEYALSLVQGKNKAKWIVLELSSYQLENCKGLNLENSAITFLSANHLERYKSVDEYYQTKCKISQMTKNVCVLNAASEDNVKYADQIQSQKILTSSALFQNQKILQSLRLLGQHNKDNFCVAYELAKASHFSENALQKMTQFAGLEHRIEFVAFHKGVTYINDSKATAMDSVMVAVQAALEKSGPAGCVYLLLGGKDKNLPWEDLQFLKTEKNVRPVYFGQCGQIAKDKMKNISGKYFPKMGEALDSIFSQVKDHDVVLLSPGGTSLDEFKNFEDRGHQFKAAVKNFIQQNG